MKYIALLSLLVAFSLQAKEPRNVDVFGGIFNGCVLDTDIDTGVPNRIGPLEINKLYTVYCYDSATMAGVACEVIQGSSTVDATSSNGEVLFANSKTLLWAERGSEYISFLPLADGTTQVAAACKRN